MPIYGGYPRDWQFALVGGYRYGRLNDSLVISESLESAGPTTISLFDRFDTRNTFHGAEVGVVGMSRWNRWSLEVLAKLALGNIRSKVFIDGATTTTSGGGAPVTAEGGILALSTNRGTYAQNDLSVMPELGVTVGCDITSRLRATFGYTFIYWSQVVRPGDQIDRDVNPTYFPNGGPAAGAPRPEFAFHTTDYWAQGMNFGLDFRF